MAGANSLLDAENIDLDYVNQAKIVYLSSFVHEPQFELQKRIIAQLNPSVKVSFAPGAIYAAKGMHQLAPLLGRTHLLFVNRDEMKQLTGENFSTGAKKCLEKGCHTVVTTLGGTRLTKKRTGAPLAYHIISREGEYLVASRVKQAKTTTDTIDAEDAFTAAFLYGFLKGNYLQKCGMLGDIMTCFSITKIRARKDKPSLAKLSRKYYENFGQSLYMRFYQAV
jgi:ribokinase